MFIYDRDFVVNFTTARPKFGGKHILILLSGLSIQRAPDTRITLCQPCGPCRRSHSLALLDRAEFLPFPREREAQQHKPERFEFDTGTP